MNKKIRVIAIIGPTAVGKSDLAVFIAQKVGGEVVSADSRQVYRGMDIGSGKITQREMKRVPHHLLDIADPKHRISVDRYVKKARAAIDDIAARGKVPIVCGGTGFYVQELLFPSSLPTVPPNKKLRAALGKKSAAELFALLQKKDPRRAAEIDRHNSVRLIRALEIAEALGAVPPRGASPSPYSVFFIYLDAPIETLREKIRIRLAARMKKGMMREIASLRKNGISMKALEAFGLEYAWGARLLAKKISKKEFLSDTENDIVAYARRQKTWFKKMLKGRKKISLVPDAHAPRKALAGARAFLSLSRTARQ